MAKHIRKFRLGSFSQLSLENHNPAAKDKAANETKCRNLSKPYITATGSVLWEERTQRVIIISGAGSLTIIIFSSECAVFVLLSVPELIKTNI